MSGLRRLALVAFCFAALHTLPLSAQGTLGGISGRITDASGAAVSGVAVTLTNPATGQEKKTVSSGDGYYTFPDLAPSTYTIRAEMKGFQSSVTSGVILQVNQTLTNDI